MLVGDAAAAAVAAGEEALDCDYCVVACEVRGVKALLGASDPALGRHVAGLGEADPYVVWRLWLDKPTAQGRLPFYTTARFRFTDSLAIYSAFQEPFVSWARRTGGSVVEVHAYAIAPEAMVPAAELRAAMWRELVALLPELAGARVLHDEFQQQSNFTRLAPGDHAHRPATATPVREPPAGRRPRPAARARIINGGGGHVGPPRRQRHPRSRGAAPAPHPHGRPQGAAGVTSRHTRSTIAACPIARA